MEVKWHWSLLKPQTNFKGCFAWSTSPFASKQHTRKGILPPNYGARPAMIWLPPGECAHKCRFFKPCKKMKDTKKQQQLLKYVSQIYSSSSLTTYWFLGPVLFTPLRFAKRWPSPSNLPTPRWTCGPSSGGPDPQRWGLFSLRRPSFWATWPGPCQTFEWPVVWRSTKSVPYLVYSFYKHL